MVVVPLVRDFFLRLNKAHKKNIDLNKKYQKEPDREVAKKLSSVCCRIKENVDYNLTLDGTEFVVFDTETTGLKPLEGDEITSIAGVIVKDGEIIKDKSFSKLVNPVKQIPKKVEKLTGITNEMVEDKEPIGPVLCEFLEFINTRPLVAHFASFDLTFLNLKLNWFCQEEIYNPVIDTFQLGQLLYPGLPSHGLDYLLEFFGIPTKGRHSAEGDAFMTANILTKFFEKLKRHEVTTLQEIREIIHHKDSKHYREKFLSKMDKMNGMGEFPYC